MFKNLLTQVCLRSGFDTHIFVFKPCKILDELCAFIGLILTFYIFVLCVRIE